MKLKNFQNHDRAFVPIALSAAARFAIIIGSLISAIVGLCAVSCCRGCSDAKDEKSGR